MPLCTPRVSGPITSWNHTLNVEGALAGATIIVREGDPSGRDVASASAVGGHDCVGLLPGVVLTAGKPLFVKQELGDESDWTTPNLVEYVDMPPVDWASVLPPWFRSHLYTCGRAVWVAGCVPGAEVTIAGGGPPKRLDGG